MSEFKLKHNRIGVLTSGGDCAGLNAAIRAITYRAIQEYGLTVVGILASTAGLLQRPVRYRDLTMDNVDSGFLRKGGTVLETVNKGNPFEYPMPDGSIKDRSMEAIEGFHALDLDALIGIGGDGSARILARLAEQGQILFIGVPKTIDNDLAETDFAIGYMSAVEVCVDAADRLQPTAASHRRTMVLEVMGRDVGWIAIATGIAAGADVVLIPEILFDIENVAAHLRSRHARGQNHALVVCSEGVRLASREAVSHAFADGEVRYGGVGATIADIIARETGAETRHRARARAARRFAVRLRPHPRELARRLCRRPRGQGQNQPLCRLARRQGDGRGTRGGRRQDTGFETRRHARRHARRLGICLGD